ncbi:MAG: LPS export ABC transporter permease LptF [Pseudomonadota bacterium]|nr:LPS export ABC transporter permease LptF [Pseudomonadota bacterium]
MKKVDIYIFRQLFAATVFVTVTLTCVVWLTQSLRFIEMIVNQGLSLALFGYFMLLLLPTFLGIILPIALFASVIFTYNRLIVDSEMVVLRSGGCSKFRLARPAITLAVLVTLICYSLTIYFMPASYREFKDLQFNLRNSLPTVLLQENVFNSIMKNVTVYIRSRSVNGSLSGIVIHDARDLKQPVTMMAEHGSIVSSKNGPRVILVKGNRQKVDPKDGQLSLLFFDQYAFDIGKEKKVPQVRWREPRERYLPSLFKISKSDQWNYQKLLVEGHHRLAMPILPIAFTLVALVLLLSGDFKRRGQFIRILWAIAVIIVIEIVLQGARNQAPKIMSLTILMYLAPTIPAVIATWFMRDKLFLNKRNRVWSGHRPKK